MQIPPDPLRPQPREFFGQDSGMCGGQIAVGEGQEQDRRGLPTGLHGRLAFLQPMRFPQQEVHQKPERRSRGAPLTRAPPQ